MKFANFTSQIYPKRQYTKDPDTEKMHMPKVRSKGINQSIWLGDYMDGIF